MKDLVYFIITGIVLLIAGFLFVFHERLLVQALGFILLFNAVLIALAIIFDPARKKKL